MVSTLIAIFLVSCPITSLPHAVAAAPAARIALASPSPSSDYFRVRLTVSNPTHDSLAFRWHYAWGGETMYLEAVPLAGGDAVYSKPIKACVDPNVVGPAYFCHSFHLLPVGASESFEVTVSIVRSLPPTEAHDQVIVIDDSLNALVITVGPGQAAIALPSPGKYRVRWVYQNSPVEEEATCPSVGAPIWHGRLESNWLEVEVAPSGL